MVESLSSLVHFRTICGFLHEAQLTASTATSRHNLPHRCLMPLDGHFNRTPFSAADS